MPELKKSIEDIVKELGDFKEAGWTMPDAVNLAESFASLELLLLYGQ